MSYALTGKLVVMRNAFPRPVADRCPVYTAVDDPTAVETGHGNIAPESSDKNSTATSPGDRSPDDRAGQLPGSWLFGTRPNNATSNGTPSRVTWMLASSGHAFARKTAKQGGIVTQVGFT